MLTGLKAWLWLTTRLEAGPAWQVLDHFDSPEQAYFADPEEYRLIPRLSEKHVSRLTDKSLDTVNDILSRCDSQGIGIVTWQDADYPERLRNIEVPPLVLYYRGKLPRFDEEIAIAMAGTRKATPYGCKAASHLAFEITRLGGLVVTGIVEGCDQFALVAALKAGGAPVCVVAGGVDVAYYNSEANRHLLSDVAARGALISEYPPGTPHLAEHFFARNRILTGLALGTVCVEAPVRSGTLNVAALALEQGRDVFAVPANFDSPGSKGTNQLLARGEAICVCSGDDVLEHYWALYPNKRRDAAPLPPQELAQRLEESKQAELPRQEAKAQAQPEPAPQERPRIVLDQHRSEYTDDEAAVLRALEQESLVTDAVVAATGLPARRVSATLTVLTIRGLVKQLPGGRFEATVTLI